MDLDSILNHTIVAAKEAGAYIKEERKNFNWSKVEQKQRFSDLVSYVDKEAELLIVNKLSDLVPGAGFITEEGMADYKGDVFNWVIDPLDGTTNYLHGLPIFSTSIALMKGNEEIVGVVYEINLDECFTARKDGGAYLNGTPITVSKAVKLNESLIATGFPYASFDKMPHYMGIINHLIAKTHGIRRLGSAAVDLAYVACGRLEGFFEFGLKSWDMAAGTLIVKEAGGKVTDFNGGGDFIFGNGMGMVSACNIHHELLSAIQEIWFGKKG
jgi:myo-inositol-1(or 4)-monophosphatase